MIRIILIFIVFVIFFWGMAYVRTLGYASIRQLLKKHGLFIALLFLLLLAVTGKLNSLFAMVGVAIAFLVRFLPVLARYAPQLYRFWLHFGAVRGRREGADYDNFRQSSTTSSGATMTRAEAFQILGLSADATEEQIVMAHRRLIAKLHPDKGGSDYLAARINLAKKVLIGR